MWPVLLNMSRDECRRTLRRLELEAYSNMMSVFRAQGALEDSRRKLLEDLREALHIGSDRHSAEARRVANDELLATIAEQLSGPNTGLGWISEGRRRIPLMPRGILQTAYAELADKVALQVAAENEEIKKKLEAERLVAPDSSEDMQMVHADGEAAESLHQNINSNDEMTMYPPIVMEDQTMKILENEAFGSRKRKVTEPSALPDDLVGTPVKIVKNINRTSNQKHLNLSQIYSNYSKTPSGKISSHSKHSYNQVSKVSSKSNQMPRSTNKRKKQNPSERSKSTTKMHKSSLETSVTNKQYNINPIPLQMDFSHPPNSFQASYAQSILSVNSKNFGNDPKGQQSLLSDSPTMRLLTQPATTPNEHGVSQPEDSSALQVQSAPIKSQSVVGKPCQFVIKKRGNITLEKTPQKVQMSDIKIIKKPADGIKVMPKKPIIVAPNAMQRPTNATGKVLQSRLINNAPSKTPTGLNSPSFEKLLVMPGNHHQIQKTISNSKNIIITSSNVTTPITKGTVIHGNNISPKIADATPKGIAAHEVKCSTKTFLLNPKSGQKMVVLPAKAKGKTNIEGQTMPLLHFKNMPTTMKLVPVSSSISQIAKSNSNVTIVSRPSISNASPINSKIIGLQSVKSQDVTNKPTLQGLQIGTKVTAASPIVRQSTAKGNVIVVQKGTPLGKTLTFSKSGSEMSKIVMGKNVNKLIQAQTNKSPEGVKKPGNVIVLDLNDHMGPTTMSKILDSHTAKASQAEDAQKEIVEPITEDTPVLFDNVITEETCNANSMDSLSTVDMARLEEGTISSIEKEEEKSSTENKEHESAKDTSSVTDWEMELETVDRKRKGDSSGSLHLELCMSSDSETDAYLVKTEKPKKKQTDNHASTTDQPSGLFGDRGGLSRASRTLLSQLQDEGSSSNDSSFTLNKVKLVDKALEKSAPSTTDKVSSKTVKSEVKMQVKRLDMFGTADMQLSSFGYLESDEGMMSGEDMFADEGVKGTSRTGKEPSLELQLSHLLSDSTSDTNNVSEMPISK